MVNFPRAAPKRRFRAIKLQALRRDAAAARLAEKQQPTEDRHVVVTANRFPASGAARCGPHHALAARGDHGVADLLERRVAARGLQVVTAQAHVHGAARDARVLALHRGDHLAERDACARETLEVDGNPYFRIGVGPGLGAAHTGRRLDELLQVFRLLGEFAPAGRFAHQRQLDDVDRTRGELPDLDREYVGGQRGPHDVDLAHDLVVLAVRVGAVDEFDLDQRETVECRAGELLDVLEAGESILDRIDNEALDAPAQELAEVLSGLQERLGLVQPSTSGTGPLTAKERLCRI